MTNSEPSKAHGTKNEIIGSIKSTTGSLLHNHTMQAKGDLQHQEGTSEKQAAAMKMKAEGTAQNVKGNIQAGVSHLTNSNEQYARGQLNQAEGHSKVNMA